LAGLAQRLDGRGEVDEILARKGRVAELLSFVRLDVRNRIVRRFPLTLPLRGFRWLVGGSNRKLARTGLLESHYERFLYGDTSLFELPERPQLHILATNLSEGCLCSFTRDGLLMVRRHPGGKFRIDRIHNLFRIDVLATSPKTQVRFPPQLLRPHLRMSSLESAAPGEKQCHCFRRAAGEVGRGGGDARLGRTGPGLGVHDSCRAGSGGAVVGVAGGLRRGQGQAVHRRWTTTGCRRWASCPSPFILWV